jgi:hypothetical protein
MGELNHRGIIAKVIPKFQIAKSQIRTKLQFENSKLRFEFYLVFSYLEPGIF